MPCAKELMVIVVHTALVKEAWALLPLVSRLKKLKPECMVTCLSAQHWFVVTGGTRVFLIHSPLLLPVVVLRGTDSPLGPRWRLCSASLIWSPGWDGKRRIKAVTRADHRGHFWEPVMC